MNRNLIASLITGLALLLLHHRTVAQETITLSGSDIHDALLYSKSPTANYMNHVRVGAVAWTNSGASYIRSLLYFNLSGIPSGADIVSANLYLYSDPTVTNPNDANGNSQLTGSNAFYLEKVTSSWNQSTVTWNTQPATTTVNRVWVGPSLSTTENRQVGLTAMVQDWVNNPAANYGVKMILENETYYRARNYASTNHTNTAIRPRLVVQFAPPLGGFNFKASAVKLTNKNNWCSQLAEYSNVGATNDGNISGCSGNDNNVWFKFQAATSYIKVDLKTSDSNSPPPSEGTLKNSHMVLLDSNNVSLACATVINSGEPNEQDKVLEKFDLVIGNWYYISVGNQGSDVYEGTFTLCISDQVHYNHQAGAVELDTTSNWCSGTRPYSTAGATPDGPTPTCSGSNQNVWFKFTAKTNSIKLIVNGSQSNPLGKPVIALWNDNMVLADCNVSSATYGPAIIERSDLVVGKLYYISVYSQQGQNGTFTLCVDDLCEVLPEVFDVTSSGQNCFGDSTVSVILSGSQTGVTYRLNHGNRVEGTGDSLLWTQLGKGIYVVTARKGVCADSLDMGSVEVLEREPFQTFGVTAIEGERCGEDGIMLHSSEDQLQYQLQRDGINYGIPLTGNGGSLSWDQMMLHSAGTYDIVVTDPVLGCSSIIPGVEGWAGTPCKLAHVTIAESLSIACTNPDPYNYALAVGGDIVATGIMLKVPQNWPDYVFNDQYRLPSLAEVERFITANHHLPNMLSARQMKENEHYNIGGMDRKLLEKVEELTLYIIDLKDKINKTKSGKIGVGTDNYRNSGSISRLTNATGEIYTLNNSINTNDVDGLNAGITFVRSDSEAEVRNAPDAAATSFERVLITQTLAIGPPREDGKPAVPDKFRLAVNGNIIANAIDIKIPEKWPDYVFATDYDLLTIEEVKAFIEKNAHLPGLASARAMYEKGDYDVGEMDVKLLEKVEELTLYILQLEEEIRDLNNKRCLSISYTSAVNNNYKNQVPGSTDETGAVTMASGRKPVSYSMPPNYSNTKSVMQSVTSNYESLSITETLAIASPKGMPSHYKLAVAGNIIARGIDIKAPGEWPDYVFDKDYNLMSLPELRVYIETHGHLPRIYSAAEMKKMDNYSIAFMDVKLLEKIEELTLHLIMLEKEVSPTF